jgi:hypothetical protein
MRPAIVYRVVLGVPGAALVGLSLVQGLRGGAGTMLLLASWFHE